MSDRPGSRFHQERADRTDLVERMRILNAYHLPDEDAVDALYSGITPVNTFRLILTSFLGESLPLLPDLSCYTPSSHPLDFQDVTARLDRGASKKSR
jgi:hypothetical protein